MPSLSRFFDLSGDVIVVTGGAGLLGRSHAEAILAAGGIPVLLDIHEPLLDRALAELGEPAAGYRCDITRRDELVRIQQEIVARFGRVDGLINNAANNPAVTGEAGMQHSSRLETMCLEQWQADLDVGLTGAFLCSQVFGPAMARAGKGSIVNISSDLGVIGPDQRLYRKPGLEEHEQTVKPVTYSVAKTGILGLTRYLATYWAHEGVRANALVLGGVENGQPQTFLDDVGSRIPMGRLARRDEYQGAIVFLCSRASSYMTGSMLVIDGGRTIW